MPPTDLEEYFSLFRNSTIGAETTFVSAYGEQKLVYADWIASGRLYEPIEKRISFEIGQMVGNTHSESSQTGIAMTDAYHEAQKIIKNHVNANDDDLILFVGSGMTSCINKLQRILGLKVSEQTKSFCTFLKHGETDCPIIDNDNRPVVFLTHIEHHSNHTTWLETFADVVVLKPNNDLTVNPENLRNQLNIYKNRQLKIGSFSACSNVTGYVPPYYELAKIMHEHGGLCFIDFAASAPYYEINMHPQEPLMQLDAIFFSPHKFLGGPGSAGVMLFNKKMYKNKTSDQPGGGTVKWTNRWGQFSYISDIETKEDEGTPGFLQAIKAALAIKLKENMRCDFIRKREKELIEITFTELKKIDELIILAENIIDRLGVFSFYIKGIHHNLVVKLLNDRFGIQVRGGCSCAGTYGHYLLNVDFQHSKKITDKIELGDLSLKPGWVRLSLHPTMTNSELLYIIDAMKQIISNINTWKNDYLYSQHTNEFYHKTFKENNYLNQWFRI